MLCALASAVSASAAAKPPVPAAEIPHTQPPASEANRLLRSHNAERVRLGLPPLVWNSGLASDAYDWAKALLARRELEHASAGVRKGNGENLWMGTAGVWTVEGMVKMFIDERRHFKADTFPNVSSTGNWPDVGHYTQIVWRDTREVGCAVAADEGLDVLVCRYYPAGNISGQKAF